MSIQYSLTALTSWVTELNDPNLVLIFMGDHQPPHRRLRPTGPPTTCRSRSSPAPPLGAQADILLALAETGCCLISGAPAQAHGRLPQSVPQYLQHGPDGNGPDRRPLARPASRGPASRSRNLRSRRDQADPVSHGRWLVSLTRWTAANPRPCHLDLVDAGGTEIQPVEGAERDAESPAQHDLYRG